MAIFRHRMQGPGTAGDIWVATMHSQSTQDIDTVHSAFSTFVGTLANQVDPMWSTETQLTQIVTDELDSTGHHNAAQRRSGLQIKGTGSGNALSPRTAIVVSLRTALPTRSGRGRFYLPGPDDTHLTTTGLFNSTDAATVASGISSAIASMNSTSVVGVFHRSLNTITPVTDVYVGQVPGDQRRRTNKVANNYQTSSV